MTSTPTSEDSALLAVGTRSGTPRATLGIESNHYLGGMNDETHDFDADAEIAFLRETPAPDLLANHFFVLAQWAAVHLATSPADLVGAQLVIDAMSAVLDAGGERLGPNVTLYRSALAEIQQVYVRASQVARAPANAPINTDTDTDTVTDTVTDSPPTPGPATDPATDPA